MVSRAKESVYEFYASLPLVSLPQNIYTCVRKIASFVFVVVVGKRDSLISDSLCISSSTSCVVTLVHIQSICMNCHFHC
jgi:hypothetical protein